jgi:hypothetical protein
MRHPVYSIATHERRRETLAQAERTKVDKKAIRDLASLASSKLHERYIDNATGDEYLLPNDLIMDCLNTMERLMLHSNYKHKDRMLNLYVYIQKQVGNYPDDLYGSQQWHNITTAVRNYLIHIEGVSIDKWESQQNL